MTRQKALSNRYLKNLKDKIKGKTKFSKKLNDIINFKFVLLH